MSGDESIALILSLILALVLWGRWLWEAIAVAPYGSRPRERWLLAAGPAAGGLLLWWVLRRFASFDVRDSPTYLTFYLVMGAAWVALVARLFSFFGLSARDDVIERANPAAARALAGALLGVTLCFAGGNIGDGPGWWVVVFCAALSTAGLLLLWLLLDRAAGLADTVTIERDPAAGTRLAGFFVAAGLILGRAVAGDWESARATAADFAALAWPALGLLAAAVILESRLRPTRERPAGSAVAGGLAPAAVYLAIAAMALRWAGEWS